MRTSIPTLGTISLGRRLMRATAALGLLLVLGFAQIGLAQTGTNQLNLFKNYFVTGDYVVAGWVEGSPDGSGYAPGTISVPDLRQPSQNGVPATVPKGADIVAAYLYWATVEKSAVVHLPGSRGFSMVMPLPEQSWETLMLPPPGVRAGVRAHPTGQRRCGPTAQTSARTFPWTRIPRPQHLERPR